MRRTFQVLMLALVAGPLTAPAAAQKGVHKDARVGFELKPPRGWQQIPLQASESWIVAKYQSDKQERTYDPQTQSSYTFRSDLTVIAFLTEQIERADVEEEEDEGEKAEIRVRATIPFRDYVEYLQKTSKGFFIEEDETKAVDGMQVRQLSVKFEPLAGPSVRLLAWVFPLEVGEVAVQVTCLDDNLSKTKRAFDKVFRSFQPIERTEDLNVQARTGGFVSLFVGSLDPQQRMLRRQELERQEWEAISGDLPDGWKAKEFYGVKVVNHVDDKYAKKCAERVNAVRRWLEETFPDVAPEEYTRTPIVRICESRDEERAFFRGTPSLNGSNEIVTHKDTTFGATSGEWNYISRRTLQLWFFDKDFDLFLNMPVWLRIGLENAVGFADVKGKSLDFGTDQFKRMLRGLDEPLAARELLTLANEDQDWPSVLQCMALSRFLLDSRSRKHREILPAYVGHVRDILDEIREEDEGKEQPAKPTNEEEEEAYFKQRQERAKALGARMREEAMSRAFAGWAESDWSDFEKAYRDSID